MNTNSHKLLVVEDSRTQAEALRLQLEGAGYHVEVERSGESALERLRRGGIDLVLSDVVMPGMDGFELCRSMKAEEVLRRVPLVLLTSLRDPLDIIRGMECGADNYVTKPYEPEHLLARVSLVLSNAERRRGATPDGPVEITFLGERFTITSERAQILDLLISSFEELIRANSALQRSQEERARQLEREQAARADAEATAGRLRLLQDVSDVALGTAGLHDFMERLLALVHRALHGDAAAILLRDGEHGELVTRAAQGQLSAEEVGSRLPVGEGLAGRVAGEALPLVVHDLAAEEDPGSPVLRDGMRSFLGAPMLAGADVVGVIYVAARQPRRFSTEDLQLLRLVADRAAAAIERARLYDRERHARVEAEEANRAKSEFLAVMSHELRTPLNAISGYAELLEMGVRGPVNDAVRQDLQRIQRNQRHLLAMINDVLNFAKLEAGHVQFQISDVPLHDVLFGIDALIEPQVRAKGLRYEYRGCDESLTVSADPEKMQQILINLLTNAIKFSEEGGVITLDCGPDEDVVTIRVHDTGIGIAPEKLNTIFEPFVQVDTRHTRAQEGVGLGLAISRDLALGMGGDLKAQSSLGEGSLFTLTLPRSTVNEQRTRTSDQTASAR